MTVFGMAKLGEVAAVRVLTPSNIIARYVERMLARSGGTSL